jgi:CBS domain-containing protein
MALPLQLKRESTEDGMNRVEDLMSRDLATLNRNDELSLADDVMRLGRIRHLPVVDEETGALVGIVSQRDLFRGALVSALGYGERTARRVMRSIPVKEVMTNDPVTTRSNTPLREAAQMMLSGKIGCLPVVDGDELVGILTEADFVSMVASGGT